MAPLPKPAMSVEFVSLLDAGARVDLPAKSADLERELLSGCGAGESVSSIES